MKVTVSTPSGKSYTVTIDESMVDGSPFIVWVQVDREVPDLTMWPGEL